MHMITYHRGSAIEVESLSYRQVFPQVYQLCYSTSSTETVFWVCSGPTTGLKRLKDFQLCLSTKINLYS